MWNPCWKSVVCRVCGKKYVCMPDADYYNSTGPEDGMCEACRRRDAGLSGAQMIVVMPVKQGPFSNN